MTLNELTQHFPAPFRVMVTGHRQVNHKDLVTDRLRRVLETYRSEHDPRAVHAISGGAEGADSLWALTALTVGVPLELFLPNRWYRDVYPAAVTDATVAAATAVHFVVDRPLVNNPVDRWREQKWWRDNFARNAAMIDAADVAVVVSGRHPRDLAVTDRGGTAHAVKLLAARSATVVWVPDLEERDIVKVRLRPPR